MVERFVELMQVLRMRDIRSISYRVWVCLFLLLVGCFG